MENWDIKAIWDRIESGVPLSGWEVGPAFRDIHARLQAVEKAALPQPYNPDEANGGTAGGPTEVKHRTIDDLLLAHVRPDDHREGF